MKVLETKCIEGNIVWFKVELIRSTEVLSQELFTQDNVNYHKKEAVKEFLAKLYDSWEEGLNN